MGHATRVIIRRPSFDATPTVPLPSPSAWHWPPAPVEIRRRAWDLRVVAELAYVGRDNIFHGKTCTIFSTNCIRLWAPDGYLHEGWGSREVTLLSPHVARLQSLAVIASLSFAQRFGVLTVYHRETFNWIVMGNLWWTIRKHERSGFYVSLALSWVVSGLRIWKRGFMWKLIWSEKFGGEFLWISLCM